MNLGLLITTFDRPSYLRECLESLKRAYIPEGTEIIVIDDCSTDAETKKLLNECGYNRIFKFKNAGICDSLIIGFDLLISKGCDTLMNLDGDAQVRQDFIERILELPDYAKIKTGFHCTTKNANGTERHKIIEQGDAWNKKASVGGINMCFSAETYKEIRRIIEISKEKRLNWDHQVCLKLGGAISVQPSVIQHLGVKSSMNHTEEPDTAYDFKALSLPNVTLVGIDDDLSRLQTAIDKSSKDIHFGAAKVLSLQNNTIQRLGSKEAYSTFILKELHKYIDTEFALIVQHDGYVRNYKAWTNEFLNYDYIGAVWGWYKDGFRVGNGGFSLRSKKLLKLTARDEIKQTHPEDHHIGRTYRPYLETKGIKFAPEALAKKFSVEGYGTNEVYADQFGFHGKKGTQPVQQKETIIFNQFFGLGDILFLVPLARHYLQQGHKVLWPIIPEYLGIKKNFPDIEFINKDQFRIEYDKRAEFTVKTSWYGNSRVLPLRWADIHCPPAKNCMRAKYDYCKVDWRMWRELTWTRDREAEDKLFSEVLKIDGEYNLVQRTFGTRREQQLTIQMEVDNGLRNVELREIGGFNLLDWAKVIENATNIHAVGSSNIYLFETLDLKAKELHLYKRLPRENHFEFYNYILEKQYQFH
jgi:glycosyltransferase involved in cell wall biosynthesis